MQSLKEKASNVAASAKSGMEKTKATVQEKVDKMKAHDSTEKEMATEKKQERIYEAEMNKQVTQDRNAALRHGADSGTGRPHYSNIGTGEPMGHVTDGIGTVAHNTHVGGGVKPGYGTGAGRQHYSNTGTGEPMGQVTDGIAPSYGTGTGRPHYSNIETGEPMGQGTDGIGTGTHNTHVGGGVNPGCGTGGNYS
ncbi:Late embryogenesis abundant protein [Capsicum baccatum]|uniref:Late embryogenesis abundant protein n=1 Tax=Capsicum baccatum TaxID=33114 RepID=A0A2G2VWE8_CAPBA|nr:Late embryogenesis abundant protein [Capsicum baccatum]